MEGHKRNPLKRRPSPQFKKKGGPKRGKWNNPIPRRSSEKAHVSDTVYRILCQSRKIGSVIGKGGSIIKALREETQAKITVEDSVPGSDERVIIVSSPSAQLPEVTEDVDMEPHCAAQDALLKIHEKIVEEDLDGAGDEDNNEISVTTRLLVPNNLVGCVLGRKGDVIQRLRSEIGASIRVLPPENLPSCAMSTDELVQVSGTPSLVKRALYEISTLLHENPRKDKPPMSYPVAHGVQGFRSSDFPMGGMLPPGNSVWPRRNHNLNGMSHLPEVGGYENQPSRYGVENFDIVPPPHGGEPPTEFTMKILCLASKIGGVIGKGGLNVRQLQQETGASIHVEDVSADSDERVIRVSSIEALWDPISQTIKAILQLQSQTSEFSDKGIITTRLLVPSSKVGCILGQGGQVINEMRRRTKADIRVFSKEEKPKCASKDEELVQISGTFGVAKDALTEIASRLRTRSLRDSNAKVEPAPLRMAPGFGPPGDFPVVSLPPHGGLGTGSSSRFDYLKGDVREYDLPNYPGLPNSMRYPNISSPTNLKIPNSTMSSVIGTGGSNIPEHAASRMKLRDPQLGGPEHFAEIHRPMEHWSPPRNNYQGLVSSSGQTSNPQQGAYQSYTVQQGAYSQYSPSGMHYQNVNAYEAPHQSIQAQLPSYPNTNAQGSTNFDIR
ncbi:KH domain-containing protein At4g18375-like isoform X1 [Ipomoea triloba]|uniref:KH domain-containing protein At4g18375-like isoform X1 n=1 Tax=Ipomoea triloba TaxID=35885 RepID=UPI00125D818C|nr:KH domain-containing protein At4g18375-like isoform X1 [Ipomoea triloba]XP_031108957.1 KH domain-containing protein At4g18375-like isoform X1 [Ipomoea triloba]XP_031108958.1 KH domain-containing protein At4g18375-like isoform X1 [Ipomoea triloba]XP_031108959.1 KH domain-containing protein At4g18375-like isoform X1 [Ipomoea triloba]XP_031108960.1 KH domain-containing protein At4g18375-like isoform X1 [Ipomoea triloba]XP_031108961.1 KH domain-containing protein At4g18375-like isoform X1 [Ipom